MEQTNNTEQTTETNIPQTESIKLIRGQRGGYGWEIRILSTDVERMKEINKKMVEEYGGLDE